MFRNKPEKDALIDQLDLQIEEHRRISKVLDKEFTVSRTEAEELAKRGLKRAAREAFNGMKDVKNNLEAIEISRIQLRRVRTQLLAQPSRLPTKTIEGVDSLLKDSQKMVMQAQSIMQPLLDRTSLVTETTLEIPDSSNVEMDDEFESFLNEIGLGEETPVKKPEPEVAYTLPDAPAEVLEAPPEKKEEEDKRKLSEDKV